MTALNYPEVRVSKLDSTVNACHPDSKFHANIKFSKTRKHCATEQKAPKSTRNSPPTPPNLVGPQRLLSDTSFHYSSVDTTRGSKSTCSTHKPTETLPNLSGRIRTQTDNNENTQNRFRNSPKSKLFWKTVPEKAHSTEFKRQKAQCPDLPSPFRSPTDEKCKKHAR